MKDSSKQRFGLMGRFHNDITDLIDSTQLTPPEVLMVLESLATYIRNMVLSKAAATRRKK